MTGARCPTEVDLGRPGGARRLSIKVYPGGQMTYLDDRSRAR